MSSLTHLDGNGRTLMVDVSDKPATLRSATASGTLRCSAETLDAVRSGTAPKGAVISTAELAGIMAAKRTSELIPLCHPLPLTKVAVRIEISGDLPGFHISSVCRATGPTGVEMEALTAVAVAALTLFDMLKAVDRSMIIGDIRVDSKAGGQSGDWTSNRP